MAELSDKRFPANPVNGGGAEIGRNPLSLPAPDKQKKIQKVAKGKLANSKKTWADKFTETFWGDDAQTVGNYILNDVLIPSAKSTLFDMIKTGAAMLLFGQAAQRMIKPGERGGGTRVSYQDYYTKPGGSRPQVIEPRSGYNFQQVIFDTRRKAEDVLDVMLDHLSTYKVVTVADFYDAADIEGGTHTDNNYGWASLSRSGVIHTSEGYMIDLPKPRAVE